MTSQPPALHPSRRSAVPPFEVMDVLDRVAVLRADGRDVISLCAGEPSGGAPSQVSAAAAELHASGRALTYTSALGIRELRQELAGHYRRWYGLDVDPARVAITTGSSGGFLLAFLAAFEAGDRVALGPARLPGLPQHPAARSAARSSRSTAGREMRFQPTPELLEQAHRVGAARRAHPRLARESDWHHGRPGRADRDLAVVRGQRRAARQRRDLPRRDLPGAGCARPAGRLRVGAATQSAIVISSFSKYWGMTGWRLGWMLLPEDLARPVDALAGNLALCPPAPAQYAAVAAFTAESYRECDAAVAEFARDAEAVAGQRCPPRLGTGRPRRRRVLLLRRPRDRSSSAGPARRHTAARCSRRSGVAITPGGDFDDRAGARSRAAQLRRRRHGRGRRGDRANRRLQRALTATVESWAGSPTWSTSSARGSARQLQPRGRRRRASCRRSTRCARGCGRSTSAGRRRRRRRRSTGCTCRVTELVRDRLPRAVRQPRTS